MPKFIAVWQKEDGTPASHIEPVDVVHHNILLRAAKVSGITVYSIFDVTDKDKDPVEVYSLECAKIEITQLEADRIRQWFNSLHDVHPEYLELGDYYLYKKIKDFAIQQWVDYGGQDGKQNQQ